MTEPQLKNQMAYLMIFLPFFFFFFGGGGRREEAEANITHFMVLASDGTFKQHSADTQNVHLLMYYPFSG